MGFSFGGFAGGFSDGFNNGVKMGKTLRDVIKEAKTQDLIEKARSEAAAQFDRDNAANGLPAQSSAPTSGPIEKEAPAVVATPVEAPDKGEVKPIVQGNPYDPGDTRTDPKPVAAPMASPESAAASAAQATPAPQPAPSQAVEPTPAPASAAPAQAAPAQAAPASPAPDAAPAKPVADAKSPVQQTASAGVPGAPVPRTPKQDAEARAAFIEQNTARAMQQHMLEQGDVEGAKKWGDYAESSRGKQAIRDWARAYTSPDFDTALTNFGKYYTRHVDDGLNYKSHELITKSDGTQVGVVTLVDKETGKENKIELTRDRMLQLGGAYNPSELFKTEQARQAAADKAKLDAKIKSTEKRQEFSEKQQLQSQKEAAELEKEKVKGRNKESEISLKGQVDMTNIPAKEKARVDAKVNILKDNGYTDEQIKPLLPAIVGAGDHKKTTDPAERRAIIATEMAKDPIFARLAPAEQQKKIDGLMSVIEGNVGKDAKTDTAPNPVNPKPAATPAAPAAQAKPVFVKDTKTGEVFQIVNGQRVKVGPQAGGLPK